jgi:hypothetical protein
VVGFGAIVFVCAIDATETKLANNNRNLFLLFNIKNVFRLIYYCSRGKFLILSTCLLSSTFTYHKTPAKNETNTNNEKSG